MPLSELLYLAFESFWTNKLRTSLTMLGLIIGVGAVVLLVSIGNGAKNYISVEFQNLGTNLIIIQPGRSDRKIMGPPIGSSKEKLTLADVEALERQAVHLGAVTGVCFGAGTIKYGERSLNTHILGSNEKLLQILNIGVAQGEFFGQEIEYGRRVVFLGDKVSKNFFGEDNPLGKMIRINGAEHRVVGVAKQKGDTLGFNIDELVFIPVRSAMRIFNEDRLFGIRAKAKDKISVDDAVGEVKAILKQRHNGQEDFSLLTELSMLQTMDTILNMLTYVLAGIAMISMIVGGIGIMNIMLVSITERTREIGVRRAVGARKSDILSQFLIEAVGLSIIGGAIGLGFSGGLTYIIYWFVPTFDMRAPIWIMLPAFGLSSLVGILFGVWPAAKAANIETIDALRFE